MPKFGTYYLLGNQLQAFLWAFSSSSPWKYHLKIAAPHRPLSIHLFMTSYSGLKIPPKITISFFQIYKEVPNDIREDEPHAILLVLFRVFKKPILMLPLCERSSNMRKPNEKISERCFFEGTKLLVAYLIQLVEAYKITNITDLQQNRICLNVHHIVRSMRSYRSKGARVGSLHFLVSRSNVTQQMNQ